MDGGATLEREFESTQQAVDRTAGTSMFHLDQQARMIHEGEQMITVCYLPREAPDWAAAHGGVQPPLDALASDRSSRG